MKGRRRHFPRRGRGYYPYRGYGYGYDPYDYYRRNYDSPTYVIQRGREDDDLGHSGIHWPTLGASLLIGALLWGIRR